MKLFSDTVRAKKRRHGVAVILTFIIALTIAVLTLLPVAMPIEVGGGDKLHHLIAFAALVLPCALFHRRLLAVVVPVAIFYGGMIELVQPSVGRHAEWRDFGADVIGVTLGVLAGLALRWLFNTWAERSRRSAGALSDAKN